MESTGTTDLLRSNQAKQQASQRQQDRYKRYGIISYIAGCVLTLIGYGCEMQQYHRDHGTSNAHGIVSRGPQSSSPNLAGVIIPFMLITTVMLTVLFCCKR